MDDFNKQQLTLAYELTVRMQSEQYDYIYNGTVNTSIVNHILSLTEHNLETNPVLKKARKRIYFIVIELLQNITRHQSITGIRAFDMQSMYATQQIGNYMYVVTGNMIYKKDAEYIENLFSIINGKSSSEMRDYYNQVLINGGISDKGGAGLGLIAIARKAEGKFSYEFKEINEEYSYFYLCTEIRLDDNTELSDIYKLDYDVDSLVDLHHIFTKEKILINFSVNFKHNNFIKLFSIILNQLNESDSLKKRIIYTMVEMIQNIVYYSKDFLEERNEKPGVFFLCEQGGSYFLTAGNYMEKVHVPVLTEKLETVNNLERKDFDNVYQNILFGNVEAKEEKPDLSFLEMRIKSKQKLFYVIRDVNSKYAFFALQTTIQRK